MRKAIVLIKKNLFIYNNQEYEFDKVSDISNLLKSNMKIVILEEELHVKQFKVSVKRNALYEFVNYKIDNDFPQNGDILYDFEKNNNLISIYYIKGAKRIEKLAEVANNMEVKPIQLVIKEVITKILKKNIFNCSVLIKFNEYYYYVCFKDGLFNLNFIEKDEDEILNKISINNNFEEVYVDNSLKNLFPEDEFKIINMNIGELINEKIYEKQRFYSRKILQ